MKTVIEIFYKGKFSFRHTETRNLTEEETHEIVVEAICGQDRKEAEINIIRTNDCESYGNIQKVVAVTKKRKRLGS